MVKAMNLSFIGLAGAIVAPLFFLCTSNNGATVTAPNSEKFTGFIYKRDGLPAGGAKVTVVRADYVPGQGVAKKTETAQTAITDKNGKFVYTSLSNGTYNIFASAEADGYASFTPSVAVHNADSGVCMVNDTLKPTGSLRGIIQFSPPADNRAALILVLGSTIMTWPDDSLGNFSLKNLAEGTYRIRFLPLNTGTSIIDTSFVVISDKTTDVGTIVIGQRQSDTVMVQDQYVSGVWGPNKTYKIMRSVTIPQGERLEIKEGTRVVFMGNYDFFPEGNCFARGTVDKPVLFTYGFNYAGQGWNYLGGYWLKSDSLVFNNCIIECCSNIYLEMQTSLPQFYFEMKNCIVRRLQSGINLFITRPADGNYNVGKRIIISNNVFHDIKTVDTLSGQVYVTPIINVAELCIPWPCDVPCVQVTGNIFYQERCGERNCIYPYNCFDTTNASTFFQGDTTCVFKDPKFVDLTKGNYHLQPGSPCIGAGKDGEDMGILFPK